MTLLGGIVLLLLFGLIGVYVKDSFNAPDLPDTKSPQRGESIGNEWGDREEY